MILGLDFDTRAVHAVLLGDDSNAARYVHVPFVEHKPPFEFDDARNVREALREALTRAGGLGSSHMDDVWLVGIEKPYSQNKDSSWKYGLVVGQILSCIPRSVPVLDIAPQEWKALTVGATNATKGEVWAWARGELWDRDAGLTEYQGWPQDGYDAYSIARAARTLNQRGIEAA